MILKLHENHGNGLEEKATEILKEIGKPSIEKVHLLFQSDVSTISTCTITALSEIMASVKDEKSWELFKAYLPTLSQITKMKLLPPWVPEKMIQFDEDRGIKEILMVIKELLNKNSESHSFGEYIRQFN